MRTARPGAMSAAEIASTNALERVNEAIKRRSDRLR